LEIGDDESGIMQLSQKLKLGLPLEQALDLDDTVLDVGITPNRADCLSMIGIAREVAALTGKRIKLPVSKIRESTEDIRKTTSVKIMDADLCPRYTARMIKNVKIGPSPVWMKSRLEAAGLRSINNVVDITNFVMLETGQPLHAFDFRFLEKGRIIVRRSKPDEEFISLDGKSRKLDRDTLLICDGVKPVAIAGIMGGLNSEVKDDTQLVLLESAYFNPTSIRRSARKLAMPTDAAFRFERGIDPEGVIKALNRAAQLIADLSGGNIYKNYIDEYPRKVPAVKNIPLRLSRVNETVGTAIKGKDILRILKNIGMNVVVAGSDKYRVSPPTYRVDIAREIDLIEEVTRLYGYDRIPAKLPNISVTEMVEIPRLKLEERIRLLLAGNGYSEVVNYSFIAPSSADNLCLDENDKRRRFVHIKNPLVEDQSVMRTTMVYGLLDTLRKNANNGCPDLSIFEIGRTFLNCGEGKLPEESNVLAGLLSGAMNTDMWGSKLSADFYDIKGCVENLFLDLKLNNVHYRSADTQSFLHPGKSCGVYIGDIKIGYLGTLHPNVLENMDLKNTAYIFELNLDILAEHYQDSITYKEISKFPAITRDVAFLVPGSMETDYMLKIVFNQEEDLLENVGIFDIYADSGLPEGKKSLGLRFSYRASDRTLTDIEVNNIHEKIVQNTIQQTGAKIRGE
jgi:phenylalanyl-tRNA synthetase beta chain